MGALTSDSGKESDGITRWTIEEAENAVKASFYSRLHEGVAREAMRYWEIREAIKEKRRISDRTLSRALRQLVEERKLRKREDGGYEPVIEFDRKDTMEVMAAADKLSIEAGASIGMMGDHEVGWTVYGIPPSKPRELRPKLLDAIEDFQEEIDDILQGQAEEIADRILKKARSRGLTSMEVSAIRRILMQVFDFWETLRFEHLSSFAWAFIMEKVAPGVMEQVAQKLLRPPVGIVQDLHAGMPPHKSMARRPQEWIPYIANLYSENEKVVRDAWPRFLAEAEAGAIAMETLRRSLRAREWKTFSNRWASTLTARYWFCAVIR